MEADAGFFILPNGTCSNFLRRRGCIAQGDTKVGAGVHTGDLSSPYASQRQGTPRVRPYSDIVGRLDGGQSDPSSSSRALVPLNNFLVASDSTESIRCKTQESPRPDWTSQSSGPVAIGCCQRGQDDLMPWALAELDRVQQLKDQHSDFSDSLLDRLAIGRRRAFLAPRHSNRKAHSARAKVGVRRKVVNRNIDGIVRALEVALPTVEAPETREPGATRYPLTHSAVRNVPSRPHSPREPSRFRDVPAIPEPPKTPSAKREKKVVSAVPSLTDYMAQSTLDEAALLAETDARNIQTRTNHPHALGEHSWRTAMFHGGSFSTPVHSPMAAKTATMVDHLGKWIGPSSTDDLDDGHEMTQREKEDLHCCMMLAKKYKLPVNEIRDILREFNAYANVLEDISGDEFKDLIRRRAHLSDAETIPDHLYGHFSKSERDNPKTRVNFERYLEWAISVMWMEEMTITCATERNIRKVAREHKVPLLDVERVKRIFDEFDTDGSGEIEECEFRHIIYKLWNVQDVSDVPVKRVRRFWRELDADGSGSAEFAEFLVWYHSKFSKDLHKN